MTSEDHSDPEHSFWHAIFLLFCVLPKCARAYALLKRATAHEMLSPNITVRRCKFVGDWVLGTIGYASALLPLEIRRFCARGDSGRPFFQEVPRGIVNKLYDFADPSRPSNWQRHCWHQVSVQRFSTNLSYYATKVGRPTVAGPPMRIRTFVKVSQAVALISSPFQGVQPSPRNAPAYFVSIVVS